VTVTLSDDGGTANGGVDTSASQTFTITVNAVNDTPSFVAGADQTVNEDAGAQTVAGWATAISAGPTNESTQILAFTVIGNTNPGLFSAGPDVDEITGDLTYTPTADANGVATITLILSDNGGGADTTAPQSFTITVNSINDTPSFTAGADQTVDEDAGPQTVLGWATGISTGPANESGQVLTFNITGNSNPGLFSTLPTVDEATGNLTYTPAADEHGTATITLTLSDDGGGADTSAPQTFVITVNSVNDVPSFTAGPDQNLSEDAPAQTIPNWATAISAGPANESGQTLTFNVSNDNNGLFAVQPAISPAGTLTYTPAADANGVANVTVTLSDDGGTANGGVDTGAPQTFTITIGLVNDVPSFTAGTDEVVNEDAGAQSVPGWATAISAGPADESGQTLTFNASNDNNGLFAVQPAVSPAGTLIYTPAANANGVATVTLTLSDNGGTANGGVDTSAPQTFTITVNPVNDVPSYVKGADQNVNEDAGAQTVPGWATGMSTGPANEAGQVLTFVVTGNTNPGLFSAGPAVDATTGDLTYTPAANTNGTATISLVISDDGGTANGGVDTSAVQTFVINVGAVNDPPSFTVGPNQTVNEDAGAQTVPGWATAISAGPADEAGQTVTFNITGNTNPGLFSVLPVVNEATGNLTYTPAANANGSATITLTLSDDGGGTDTSSPQNFIITVSPVNDVPSFIKGPDQTVLEDSGAQTVAGWATAISAGPANEAGQVLTFNITGNTNPGLFSAGPAVDPITGDLSYTTAANANGFTTITLTISDNGGGTDTSAPQSFVINVTPVNDAPSFTQGGDQAVPEDSGPQTVPGWASAISAGPANEAGQVLTFNITGNTNPGLFAAGPVVNPITGNLTYTPAASANGSATITLTLSDNGGTLNGGVNTSGPETFVINVVAINNAPSFTAGANQTVNEDAGAQSVPGWATAISAGPANESGQVLTFNITGNTNPGLFSAGPAVAANGTLTFTPTANANGSANITLTLSDNGGTANGGADTSGPQTFTITVNPVNDAPSFTAGPDQTINEDAGPITVPNWATGISVGPANETGQTLAFNVTNDNNGLFAVQPAVAANGTLTYTAAANTNGSATVTVILGDNGGTANGGVDTSAAQTFIITVDPNDDPPVAVDDTATVWQDSPANTIDVLFNDTDIDGGAKLVTITTLASNGTVTNNTTDVSYQPDTGYCGPDSFTYTLNGGSTATVDITVTCKTTVTAVITASDKVYNGSSAASFTCALLGVISPDDVSCTGGSASFPDKNSGTGLTVTATGLGLSGADAFKYQLAATTATDTADITPRPLLVTATGVDKIFDGNTTAIVNLSDDRLTGDDLTVTYASASFADPNVGVNKPVSVTGISISGGADAGNYTPNTTANTTASIGIQTQTITVIVPAPPAATNGSSFDVEAIASSGLPVTITTSGACSGGDTDGTATITMTSGTGTCTIFYNQAGDGNYIAAPQVTEVVNATLGPVFTSANNTAFDLGFPGNFDITATGNPSTMTITVTGTLPGGITLTDNGDGTATFSGTPTNAGVFNLILTANNGVLPNAVQNFTMTVRNGPTAKGINTVPDTGDASLIENESIASELNLTHIIVEFSQDVYNPSGDSDTDDVTNPANYVLVRSATGAFQTVSCAGGALAPDVAIKVNSVAYSNGGGSAPGPYIATLSVNDGLPLNVDGYYRLYVCGTTSIVDAANTGLVLAGNGVTPGTDFHRNFRITAPGTGGGGDDDDDDGGDGGGSGTTGNISTNTASLNGVLIPVTGFAPNRVTKLPEQPAEYAYTDSGLVIEIPSLGVKVPIVGVQFKDRKWDVTWLAGNVGFLEGSAYPTWKGNTVITGHVTDTNGKPGPFAYINELQVGNKVYVHNDGFIYVYEVRQTRLLLPASTRTLFRHEDDSWLSLITCENLNSKGDKFTQRRLVRAVLISIIPEK
ncbi:MAG: sortase, partial [Anaerolineales bacterium]|nr:sortase [Anaerolineales bacterium]